MILSASERRTLRSICEAFCPSLSDEEADSALQEVRASMQQSGRTLSEDRERAIAAWCRSSATDLQVAEQVEAAIASHLVADKQRELRLLLGALGTSVGTLLLCGRFAPFADLTRSEREECLRGLRKSSFATKRKTFNSLKVMATSKFVNCFGPAGEPNLAWEATGYPAPAPSSQVREESADWDEFRFQMLNDEVIDDVELEVDVVVVGSGCGGGVAAARLSEVASVLVLEKGGYFPRGDMDGSESQAFDRMYDSGGLLTTEDTCVSVLAGSAFGGGSSVNWACCLRTPEYVREEWASEHGLNRFGPASPAFDSAMDAVCRRIGVREGDEVVHNKSNSLFVEACDACGYSVRTAGQNMRCTEVDAPGAGNISIGDRHGIKNSTPETFLRDAAQNGCRFAERCHVDRVTHTDGRATGAAGTILGRDGKRHGIVVKAREAVIVSCGSVHTPALLLRSGLPNKNGMIGKNLRLHPVVGFMGQLPEKVEVWRGAPMTSVSDEGADGTDGSHYGFKLEVPSLHLGLCAAIMPWPSAAGFRADLAQVSCGLPTIVLCRDKGSGEVRIDGSGNPRLYYPVSSHDREQLTKGAEMCARLTAAAGARRMISTSVALEGMVELPPLPDPGAKEEERRLAEADRSEAVEAYCSLIRERGVRTDQSSLIFSAHQMGTARMSATPDRGVCKESGEAWELKGLYVADASLFPTSSGSNPMLTTMTLAYDVASRLQETMRNARLAETVVQSTATRSVPVPTRSKL